MTTSLKKYKQPLICFAFGIAACLLIILFCAPSPVSAVASFFSSAFTSVYSFGCMLNTAAFLMIAGCGACAANKSGCMNLGGEGAIYLGGFVSCLMLNALSFLPPLLNLLVSAIAAALCGILMSFISAVLYEKRGALILLTSFLFSSAIIPLIDGFITSSNRTSGSNLMALPFIPKNVRLPRLLPPSPLNLSFVFAIIFCLLTAYLIYRTTLGRHMTIWGISGKFAESSGYNRIHNTFFSMMLFGILHGLTGFFAVTGTYYTCHKGFYTMLGWNALSASLLCQSNPLLLIPSSILLSWLYTSADNVSLTQVFSFDISSVLQGIILFVIAIPAVMKNSLIGTKKKISAEGKK